MAKWMAEAFGKHPGALHRQLHVPLNKKIPGSKLQAAIQGKKGKLAKKRAIVARTAARY